MMGWWISEIPFGPYVRESFALPIGRRCPVSFMIGQAQIIDLEAKGMQPNVQLMRESTLGRGVGPSVPWYPVR